MNGAQVSVLQRMLKNYIKETQTTLKSTVWPFSGLEQKVFLFDRSSTFTVPRSGYYNIVLSGGGGSGGAAAIPTPGNDNGMFSYALGGGSGFINVQTMFFEKGEQHNIKIGKGGERSLTAIWQAGVGQSGQASSFGTLFNAAGGEKGEASVGVELTGDFEIVAKGWSCGGGFKRENQVLSEIYNQTPTYPWGFAHNVNLQSFKEERSLKVFYSREWRYGSLVSSGGASLLAPGGVRTMDEDGIYGRLGSGGGGAGRRNKEEVWGSDGGDGYCYIEYLGEQLNPYQTEW